MEKASLVGLLATVLLLGGTSTMVRAEDSGSGSDSGSNSGSDGGGSSPNDSGGRGNDNGGGNDGNDNKKGDDNQTPEPDKDNDPEKSTIDPIPSQDPTQPVDKQGIFKDPIPGHPCFPGQHCPGPWPPGDPEHWCKMHPGICHVDVHKKVVHHSGGSNNNDPSPMTVYVPNVGLVQPFNCNLDGNTGKIGCDFSVVKMLG